MHLDIGTLKAAAVTSTHLWYADGMALHCRDLNTHIDELKHVYKQDIRYILANDTRCVVETGKIIDHTLWMGEAPWKPFIVHVQHWILTPNRIVYVQRWKNHIMAWDFKSSPSFVAIGYVCGASDRRIVYDDNGRRKWQDGTSARRVEWLHTDDTVHFRDGSYSWGEPKRRRPRYKLWTSRSWLRCKSRTDIRLKRLLTKAVAMQLNSHS